MKLSEQKTVVIKTAALRVGINTVTCLSKKTRIPYSTLTRKLRNPGELTLRELVNINRIVKMTDEEIIFLVRETRGN